MTEIERQAHAYLDLPSRRMKGMKIERLLDLESRQQPFRLLEVGTGSGGIAHYFATHVNLQCDVTAVDTRDNRLIDSSYDFQVVDDTHLPFDDGAFDVVVSNHVIEHVGDESAQLHHLEEIRRVMAEGGICYLAVPNRWMLREPHYGLAFLSWLPHRWRTRYLRAMRKGTVYDCEPLEMHRLERLLGEAKLAYCNKCIGAWRLMLEIERPNAAITRILSYTPDALLAPVRPLFPTLVYIVSR
jgi:SAM-dependent methyltransferase